MAGVLAGCDRKPSSAVTAAGGLHPGPRPAPSSTRAAPATPHAPTAPATLPPIPSPAPGPSQIIWQGPPAAVAARQIAITIDDGYCAECAQAYAALAEATGIHITFNPNGCYSEIWNPLAKTLKPLIEAGHIALSVASLILGFLSLPGGGGLPLSWWWGTTGTFGVVAYMIGLAWYGIELSLRVRPKGPDHVSVPDDMSVPG